MLGVMCVLPLLVVAEGPKPSLTLKEVLARAWASHPQLRQGQILVASRGADVRAAAGAFDNGLQISAGGDYGRAPNGATAEGFNQAANINGSVSFRQQFASGTTFSAALIHGFSDQFIFFPTLNPTFSTNLQLGVTQPLLQGLGSSVTEASIRQAEALKRSAERDLERTAELVAGDIAVAYWNLSRAAEEVAIRKISVERAQKLLDFTNRLIERGSLAKSAAAQAESTVALRVARLLGSQRTVEEAEGALLGAMLVADLTGVTAAERAPAPTEKVPTFGAGKRRADLVSLDEQLGALEEVRTLTRDRARPRLDLGAQASLSGLGGSASDACALQIAAFQAANPPVPQDQWPEGCIPGGDFDGYPATFTTLFTGGYFTIGLNLTLVLPLINEGAEGAATSAELTVERTRERISEVTRSQANEVAVLAKLASRDREAYAVSKTAFELATKLLDVEQKRYELGAATTFDVLRVQDELSEAESLEAQARATVTVTDLRLALAAGQLLSALGMDASAIVR